MPEIRLRERIQYAVARLTDYLPERVQLRMSGEAPLVMDGLRFDAHAQLLRSARKRRHSYRLTEPTIDAGRNRYRRETAAFRGPVTNVGNVRELEIPGPGGSLRARLYEPPSPSGDLLVYLHGGGFVIGDLDTHDEPCRMISRYSGVQVLSVEYRLAPEHKFPAAVDDARAALAWAQQHAASFGAQRVLAGGDSAGANLATVASMLATREGAAPFAQLLIYPVTDSRTDRESQRLFGDGHFLTSVDRAAFGRCYMGGSGVPRDDPRVSPLHGDLKGMPRALVVTAGFDLLRDEGEEYADALAAAGNVVRKRRVESLGHGFIHLTGVCRTAKRAMVDVATEFRELLES